VTSLRRIELLIGPNRTSGVATGGKQLSLSSPAVSVGSLPGFQLSFIYHFDICPQATDIEGIVLSIRISPFSPLRDLHRALGGLHSAIGPSSRSNNGYTKMMLPVAVNKFVMLGGLDNTRGCVRIRCPAPDGK